MRGRLFPALAGATLFCLVSASSSAWAFGVPIDPGNHTGGNGGLHDPCAGHLDGCFQGALGITFFAGVGITALGIVSAQPELVGFGLAYSVLGAGALGTTAVSGSSPSGGSNTGRFANTNPPGVLGHLDPSYPVGQTR